VDRGISASQPLRVETRRGVLSVHWRRGGHDGTVSEATVDMGSPILALARVPLDVVGPFAERHPWFPERMNVHFVQVLGPGEVRMRTWERGSGATQACGTGASAVCVAGVLTVRTQSPLLAHLPGGDLVLEWSGAEASVRMTGPAVEVFQGALDLGAQPVGQAR